MEFRYIPAGEFLMGIKERTQVDDITKIKQYIVNIPYDYWVARFPVTNELYNEYVISKGTRHPVDGWEHKRNHPVVRVRRKDAMAYCKWLNGQIQNSEFKSRNLEIRLPVEVEWEKSCARNRWKAVSLGKAV
ncbi:MAG: SUMF1/EgtB/PvdO family nonheme iron enzyme [Anaerolineales bacterium]